MGRVFLFALIFSLVVDARTVGNSSVIAMYYPSWRASEEGNQVFDLRNRIKMATHLTYAFFELKEDSQIIPPEHWTDPIEWSDDEGGTDMIPISNGFYMLYQLRSLFPNLKLGVSIGGHNSTVAYSAALSTPSKIVKTANSIRGMMEKYGFDYVDIDWEFPETREDGSNFGDFIEVLDAVLRPSNGKSYGITIALPGGVEDMLRYSPDSWPPIDLIAQKVDYIFFMTYDYNGPSWSETVGHIAPLHGDRSVSRSIEYLCNDLKISPEKIVLGIPLYGHVFFGASDIGTPCIKHSESTELLLDTYTVLYSELADHLLESNWDRNANASYIHYRGINSTDHMSNVIISHESPTSLTKKLSDIVRDRGLAGVFFWEISGDVSPSSENSLIRRAHEFLKESKKH